MIGGSGLPGEAPEPLVPLPLPLPLLLSLQEEASQKTMGAWNRLPNSAGDIVLSSLVARMIPGSDPGGSSLSDQDPLENLGELLDCGRRCQSGAPGWDEMIQIPRRLRA
jgi:hypothetical protein